MELKGAGKLSLPDGSAKSDIHVRNEDFFALLKCPRIAEGQLSVIRQVERANAVRAATVIDVGREQEQSNTCLLLILIMDIENIALELLRSAKGPPSKNEFNSLDK